MNRFSVWLMCATTIEISVMGKGKYRNKAPFSSFRPDPSHWTRKGSSWKQKVGYDTEDEAWEFLEQNPKLKAMGEKPYLCEICSRWHVGRAHKKQQT